MLYFKFQKIITASDTTRQDYEDDFELEIYDDKNNVLIQSTACFTLKEITDLAINLTKFEDISTSINFTPEKDED